MVMPSMRIRVDGVDRGDSNDDLSKIAGDAICSDLVHEFADLEEMTADGGEAGIRPDLRLAMHEGGGKDAGMTTNKGGVPVEFVLICIRESPCELSFIPAQFVGQGEFPASRFLV